MIIFEKSTFQGKNKSKRQFDDERVIVNKIFSLFTTVYSNILLFFHYHSIRLAKNYYHMFQILTEIRAFTLNVKNNL